MLLLFIFSCVVVHVFGITLSQRIENKELMIKELSMDLLKIYDDRCGHITVNPTCSYDSCQSTLYNATCNNDATISGCKCAGMLMSLQKSSVRLPESVATSTNQNPSDSEVKDSMLYSVKLDPYFEDIEKKDPTTEWLGYGSWDGMMRIYPGRAQSSCGGYDPRERDWYAAASSGPKDVVLVIDRSGSMSSNSRWEIAVSAAKAVLKTLNWMDYVSIITFDDKTPTKFIWPYLVPATKENKDKLKEQLDLKSSGPKGGLTNFEAAFNSAFDVIKESRKRLEFTNCSHSTAILFLSDGDITVGMTKPNIYTHVKQLNDALLVNSTIGKAILFTFSLSSEADETVMHQLACDSDGLWQHIPDGGDLMGRMASFYNYFSIGMADGKNRTVWVEPYNFSTDGTLGTSVSMPIYNYDTNPPLLLGVLGAGTSVKSMNAEYGILLEKLIAESKFCPTFNLTKCQLEALRYRSWGSTKGLCKGKSPGYDTCDLSKINLYPQACEAKVYPANLWCNVEKKPYLDRACCCDSTPDTKKDDEEENDDSEDDANGALYALFALLVIPGIVVIGCFVCVVIFIIICALCGGGTCIGGGGIGTLIGGGGLLGGGGCLGGLAGFFGLKGKSDDSSGEVEMEEKKIEKPRDDDIDFDQDTDEDAELYGAEDGDLEEEDDATSDSEIEDDVIRSSQQARVDQLRNVSTNLSLPPIQNPNEPVRPRRGSQVVDGVEIEFNMPVMSPPVIDGFTFPSPPGMNPGFQPNAPHLPNVETGPPPVGSFPNNSPSNSFGRNMMNPIQFSPNHSPGHDPKHPASAPDFE